MDAIGNLGLGKPLVAFEEEIRKAERGLFVSWNELNQLASKFHQIIDTEIIGCKDQNLLQRYKEQEMYETCDIVIVMFDSSYWEIFSKDEEWRGRGEPGSEHGAWYNSSTKDSLHPDLNHPPPVKPHWDYEGPNGVDSRLFIDGSWEPKYGKKDRNS